MIERRARACYGHGFQSLIARNIALPLFGALLLAAMLLGVGTIRAQEDESEFILPDIFVDPIHLNDLRITPTELRVSNGTANLGPGILEIRGLPPDPDEPDRQLVIQRLYRKDGTFEDFPAGRFVFHPTHDHVHIENWSVYRLRELLPGDEIGEVVRKGKKTSFCILDLRIYDSSLPNFGPRRFPNCGSTIQGLTVGWVDVYHRSLDGQDISLLGIEDGVYWLESEVDPDDHFIEANENNNIARRIVVVGQPEGRVPDAFEPNDSREQIDAYAVGWPNSANLGPVGPHLEIRGLTITEGDVDVFRFYRPEGEGSDISHRPRVIVDSEVAGGKLSVDLIDESGEVLWSQTSLAGYVPIFLDRRPAGWYYLRVSGIEGSTNPRYSIEFRAPNDNDPPEVEVLSPAGKDVSIVHGVQNFEVLWNVTDPEGEPTWASVFLNDTPELDGTEQLATTTLRTPSEFGGAIVSTAEFETGRYYVYVQATDGASVTGTWADVTLSFVDPPPDCSTKIGGAGDCNGNGVVDSCEIDLEFTSDCDGNGIPDECDLFYGVHDRDNDLIPDRCQYQTFHRGDFNADGFLDVSDVVSIIQFLFAGGDSPSCLEAANANNDKRLDVSDGIFLLNHLLLRSKKSPPFPGPPGGPGRYLK